MAIQEQVEILQQGVAAWNEWRAQHRDGVIDLSNADLDSIANLIRANLIGVNLSGANLIGVNLSGSDLSFATLSGATLCGANLSGATLSSATLSGANLGGSNLSRADLSEATFIRANLSEATLIRAVLIRADLSGATLIRANLSEATLIRANIIRADLRGADLSYANLRGATLSEAKLSGAKLSGAFIGWTHFADIDLRTVKGLETIEHFGPSYISTGTLESSQGNIPEAFLRGAGLNDTFIEYVRSLTTRPIEYHTCFLSYSNKDQGLAGRLYADLQSKGVRCWMAPHDLRPGDYHHSRIDEAIRVHEKVLLLLSEHAVNSSWVKHEVQIALACEIAQDRTILFPLRLDEEVIHTSKDWAAQLRESRHIGDFTGWKDHDTYQAAFRRLLRDLKAEPVKKSE